MTAMTFIGAYNSAYSAAWDDPNVQLSQRISDRQFVDGRNGRIVSTQGMPDEMRYGTTPATPAAPGNTGSGTSPNNTNTTPANNGSTPAKGWKGMSTTGKVMGVLGAAGGAYGIYESTTGQGEHGAMNVVGGTASGAIMGASVGSMVPVIGTTIGAVGGAIVGGVISGSQLFSETDCLRDPITGKFTCCNTAFNKGERQVTIGGYMFCADENNNTIPGGVRQCTQGGKAKQSSWWDGLWEDDEWTKECTPKWCKGQQAPKSGTQSALIDWRPDQEKICWSWDCKQGYKKQNNTCVQVAPASTQSNQPAQTVSAATAPTAPTPQYDADSYDKMIQKVQALREQMQNDCIGEQP